MKKPADVLVEQCREFDMTCLVNKSNVTIYFLFFEGEIVYVGQTVSLAHRLVMHLNVGKTFDRVTMLDVPADEGDLHEGAFIRLLNPRLCFGAPKDVGRDEEILSRFGLKPDANAAEQFDFRRWERRTASETFWEGVESSRETRIKLYRDRKAPQESRRGHQTHLYRAEQRRRAVRLFVAVDRLFAEKAKAS